MCVDFLHQYLSIQKHHIGWGWVGNNCMIDNID